ncbi:hypothetical protein D3C84_721490 [compost metagenome]
MPYLLVVKATAPNTPRGARRTIMAMMRKITWLNSLTNRATPLACSPTRFRALPNSTENSRTWRMSFWAKALNTDDGIKPRKKATGPCIAWVPPL